MMQYSCSTHACAACAMRCEYEFFYALVLCGGLIRRLLETRGLSPPLAGADGLSLLELRCMCLCVGICDTGS